MIYYPKSVIWETTLRCNLSCHHCGSSCGEKARDELSTVEAFDLIDQIVALQPESVTLSGGEPLIREDIDAIISRLSASGLSVRIMSNGLLLDEAKVRTLKGRIDVISLSIDGTQDVHDQIRCVGAYDKLRESIALLQRFEIPYNVVTTVMKENILLLEDLCKELVEFGVINWQLQAGMPEGHLADKKESLLKDVDFYDVIDFAYQENQKGKINVILADNIGYYSKKDTVARQMAMEIDKKPIWKGCHAGIRIVGILSNGDVVGCTTLRGIEFVEGNIRNSPLSDIWNSPDSFSWRRNLTVNTLGENCKACSYGKVCLGGCSYARYAANGSVSSDNPYCIYANRESIQIQGRNL